MEKACMDDIMAYHTAVRKMFDSESSEIFPNNNESHAAAIIEEIFLHAANNIKVFCRNLNPATWDNQGVLDALLNAASRGVLIQVYTQEEISKDSRFAKMLNLLNISEKRNVRADVSCNFVVADHKMFRFEKDANECHAIASANCPELGKALSNFFDDLIPER